jgi:aldehyde:ferredoxin oxidoreductase
MRAFNAREGLVRDHDTLPAKLYRRPLTGGRSDGVVLDEAELATALDIYYEMAGWDVVSGVPAHDTLANLGLAWAAEQLVP